MLIQLYCWTLGTTGEPARTQEQLAQALREIRQVLLNESDWTQMPDCPLSEEVKNDWRIWRQEMRDITSTATFPLEHTFQLPPTPVTGRPKSWDNWDLSTGIIPWGEPKNIPEEVNNNG